MGIFDKLNEKRDLKKVVELERLWDYGNLERLAELLSYLKNPSSEVRSITILAIGEYLPVIKEKKRTPEGKSAIETAVDALLEHLPVEDNEDNLILLGIAFGNTAGLFGEGFSFDFNFLFLNL